MNPGWRDLFHEPLEASGLMGLKNIRMTHPWMWGFVDPNWKNPLAFYKMLPPPKKKRTYTRKIDGCKMIFFEKNGRLFGGHSLIFGGATISRWFWVKWILWAQGSLSGTCLIRAIMHRYCIFQFEPLGKCSWSWGDIARNVPTSRKMVKLPAGWGQCTSIGMARSGALDPTVASQKVSCNFLKENGICPGAL